jgi:uncharacterized protein
MKTSQPIQTGILYSATTILISWTYLLILYIAGLRLHHDVTIFYLIAYMFIPALVAVAVQKFALHSPIKKPLGISFRINKWFLVALIVPIVISLMALATSLLVPGVSYSPDMYGFISQYENLLSAEEVQGIQDQLDAIPFHPILFFVFQALVAGGTINAVAAFGEELGWRGFLQKYWARYGFWKPSLFIGVIWGVWHAPLIAQGYNYPEYPFLGILMMTMLTILLSPIMSYIRIMSGSVLTAAIFHGSFNASVGLSFIFLEGGTVLTVGIMGFAGFAVLTIINTVLYKLTRNNETLLARIRNI